MAGGEGLATGELAGSLRPCGVGTYFGLGAEYGDIPGGGTAIRGGLAATGAKDGASPDAGLTLAGVIGGAEKGTGVENGIPEASAGEPSGGAALGLSRSFNGSPGSESAFGCGSAIGSETGAATGAG